MHFQTFKKVQSSHDVNGKPTATKNVNPGWSPPTAVSNRDETFNFPFSFCFISFWTEYCSSFHFLHFPFLHNRHIPSRRRIDSWFLSYFICCGGTGFAFFCSGRRSSETAFLEGGDNSWLFSDLCDWASQIEYKWNNGVVITLSYKITTRLFQKDDLLTFLAHLSSKTTVVPLQIKSSLFRALRRTPD